MKKIELTQGLYALCDDEDYEMLMEGPKWQAAKSGNNYYAIRSRCLGIKTPKGYYKKETERMHVLIVGKRKGLVIDHINHNGLDNRKENLRFSTTNQNQHNRGKNKENKTGYKGVWAEKHGGYRAQISIDNERIYLGVYKTPADAALAYNIAAIKYHRKFAKLNDIPKTKTKAEKYEGNYTSMQKRIVCINTGIKYKSISEAARTLNLNRASISNALIRGHTLDGLKFKYET